MPSRNHRMSPTRGCLTSVGVSFTLDASRCSAAYIDVHLQQGRGRVLFDQRMRDPGMLEQLFEVVQAALERECGEAKWRVHGNAHFGTNVVVVCERLRDKETGALHRDRDYRGDEGGGAEMEDTLPGRVVVDAVLGWLEGKLRPPPRSDWEVLDALEKSLGSIELEVRRRSGFVVELGGLAGNLLGEVGGRAQDVEAVQQHGLREWRWVWDVSDTSPRWRGRGVIS